MEHGLRLVAAFVGLVVPCLAFEVPQPLVDRLNADEFAVREQAQKDLVEWGLTAPEDASEALYKTYKTSEHPEIRKRCYAVLRDLIYQDYSNHGPGFVGITMNEAAVNFAKKPKLRRGVRVIDVLQGHGAAEAGIRLNDVIVGIEGQDRPEGFNSDAFRDVITGMKPKTKVTLNVLRAGELMNIEVTLGRRPLTTDPRMLMRPGIREQFENRAKEEYFKRWLEEQKVPG